MNASRIVCLIAVLLAFVAGCSSQREEARPSGYTKNMVAMERWISESPTFVEFEKQLAASQRPTFYVDMKFEKFTPDASADLVSMRSAKRKSPHEVVISGAAWTKAHEGVQYRIVIDEAVAGK